MTQWLTILHGSGRLQVEPKDCASRDGENNVACEECFCAKTFMAQMQALYPNERVILMRELDYHPEHESRIECAILIPDLRIIARGRTPQAAMERLIKERSKRRGRN